jgi:hypothetical protein
MGTAQPTAYEASLLMGATIAASMIGIFIGIFFLFADPDIAVRVAAAMLVGAEGLISFIRYAVYYRSDQIRMGWQQEHPEFRLEVGYANLALGIWALAAAVFNWGLVCGVMLAAYATYLLCALLLHLSGILNRENMQVPEHRRRALRSIASTGIFVLALAGFAILAFARAGVLLPGHL